MRSVTIGFFVFVGLASTVLSAAQAQDNAGESLIVQGWRYCTAQDSHSCIKPGEESTVQAYSHDGDPLGPQNLSGVRFPLAAEFNPEYSLVKIADRGCGTAGACWVMKKFLQVQYCQYGSRTVAGMGSAASQSATSMGSGAGCRQQ